MARAGRARSRDERSQLRNRELARSAILEQLRAATKVPRKRKPTGRPRRKERRLEEEARGSQTKRLRRRFNGGKRLRSPRQRSILSA
jgi:hypothetical protein